MRRQRLRRCRTDIDKSMLVVTSSMESLGLALGRRVEGLGCRAQGVGLRSSGNLSHPPLHHYLVLPRRLSQSGDTYPEVDDAVTIAVDLGDELFAVF